jgi:hypothetical protein
MDASGRVGATFTESLRQLQNAAEYAAWSCRIKLTAYYEISSKKDQVEMPASAQIT